MTEWEPALNAALRARLRGERAPAPDDAPKAARARPTRKRRSR